MALYHSITNSSQMRISKRDNGEFTHRYYFSNLDLNSFNAENYSGLSSFAHKQSNKENLASKLEGQYKGNYYYYVSSGSIFQKIDAKNRLGVEYIQQRYNDLYNLS